ncbi:MAG TPA: hypothetical protein EYG71_02730 [Leucothrix sp.]|nr:hypothetical protein [Leucothrix sp.]
MKYRRADIKGGTYFFTSNLADRQNTLLVDEFDKLRTSINKVKHVGWADVRKPNKSQTKLTLLGFVPQPNTQHIV